MCMMVRRYATITQTAIQFLQNFFFLSIRKDHDINVRGGYHQQF